MAARMPFGCLIVSLVIVAAWAGSAHGQYLYAGPGVIVQRQVRGPFVYGLPPYAQPLPGPRLTYPFHVPRTFVPAPGPYLQGPVAVPPGQTYSPNPRPPGNVTPYGIPIRPYLPQPYSGNRAQPYRGYQPRPDRPRFADPYASPQWRYDQSARQQANPVGDSKAPNAVQESTGSARGEAEDHVGPPEDASRRPEPTVTEPNRPAGP